MQTNKNIVRVVFHHETDAVMFSFTGDAINPTNESLLMRGLRANVVKMIERAKRAKRSTNPEACQTHGVLVGRQTDANKPPMIVGIIDAPWLVRRQDLPKLFYRIQQQLRTQLLIVKLYEKGGEHAQNA
jgi:hypothetical protein